MAAQTMLLTANAINAGGEVLESQRAFRRETATTRYIAFSIIGEIITGKGALVQLNIQEIEPLVLFNVAFFFFAAINPGTGKFVTDDGDD